MPYEIRNGTGLTPRPGSEHPEEIWEAYYAGRWVSRGAPPVCTARWSDADWIRWIGYENFILGDEE